MSDSERNTPTDESTADAVRDAQPAGAEPDEAEGVDTGVKGATTEQEPSVEGPGPASDSSGELVRQKRRETARRYEAAAARGDRPSRKRRRRRQRRRDATQRVAGRVDRLPLDTWQQGLFVVVVAGSVLAVGAVHTPTIAAVTTVAAVLAAISLWLRSDSSARMVGPTLLCWGLALWSLLQLVPLPIGWLHAIAPTNADIWSRALIPFGEPGPSYASLSLDPGATMVEAARWFTYGAIFTSASRIAERRGTRWVMAVVFGAAVATALVTVGHGLAGMKKVYGVYQPSFEVSAWRVGPLLNPNNLAGLLNLGALTGLGLVLTSDRGRVPWLLLTGVATLVGVSVISASRGGVLLLFVAVFALAIVMEVQGRSSVRGTSMLRTRAMLGATLLAGVVLAVLGGRSAIWKELFDENAEKLRHVGLIEPAVSDFQWLGMGRGSFESVFPAYQTTGAGVVYTHAENFVAHWIVEWGAPMAVLAVLLFAFYLRPKRMGVWRTPLAAAAWIGVMAVLVQNQIDLGLEVPGVCVPLAAALGGLWGDPRTTTTPVVTTPGTTKPTRCISTKRPARTSAS